jgi:hypothetical protein
MMDDAGALMPDQTPQSLHRRHTKMAAAREMPPKRLTTLQLYKDLLKECSIFTKKVYTVIAEHEELVERGKRAAAGLAHGGDKHLKKKRKLGKGHSQSHVFEGGVDMQDNGVAPQLLSDDDEVARQPKDASKVKDHQQPDEAQPPDS